MVALIFRSRSGSVDLTLRQCHRSLTSCKLPSIPFRTKPLLAKRSTCRKVDLSRHGELLNLFIVVAQQLPVACQAFIRHGDSFSSGHRHFRTRLGHSVIGLLLTRLSSFRSCNAIGICCSNNRRVIASTLQNKVRCTLSVSTVICHSTSPHSCQLRRITSFLYALRLAYRGFQGKRRARASGGFFNS